METAFDYISTKDFSGERQLKNHVSDKDLRAMIAECRRVADQANIPAEGYDLDVAVDPAGLVGRAAEQVDEFLDRVVQPVRDRYPDLADSGQESPRV